MEEIDQCLKVGFETRRSAITPIVTISRLVQHLLRPACVSGRVINICSYDPLPAISWMFHFILIEKVLSAASNSILFYQSNYSQALPDDFVNQFSDLHTFSPTFSLSPQLCFIQKKEKLRENLPNVLIQLDPSAAFARAPSFLRDFVFFFGFWNITFSSQPADLPSQGFLLILPYLLSSNILTSCRKQFWQPSLFLPALTPGFVALKTICRPVTLKCIS